MISLQKFFRISLSLVLCLFLLASLFSFFLSNEKALERVSSFLFEANIEARIESSVWHPKGPYLHLSKLSYKTETLNINLSNVDIDIDFFDLLFNKKIKYFSADTLDISFLEINTQAITPKFIDLQVLFSQEKTFIREISINYKGHKLFVGSLSIFSQNNSKGIEVVSKDNSLKLQANVDSNKRLKGFIKAEDFVLQPGVCKQCKEYALRSGNFWLSIENKKLVKFEGNFSLNYFKNRNFETLEGEIKMVDNKESTLFSIKPTKSSSDYPLIFLGLSRDQFRFFIPQTKFEDFLGLPFIKDTIKIPNKYSIEGYLNNLNILFIDNSLVEVKTDFKNLVVERNKKDLFQGLEGRVVYSNLNSSIKIDALSILVNNKDLFSEEILFNNFKAMINLDFSSDKILVSNNYFSTFFNESMIQGRFSIPYSPHNNQNDFVFFMNSKNMSNQDLLKLFPNSTDLQPINSWMSRRIGCGTYEYIDLFYRGSVNLSASNSSSSFFMEFSGNEFCYKDQKIPLTNVKLKGLVQDDRLLSRLDKGDIRGANISGDIEIITNNKNQSMLQIESKVTGNFSSLYEITASILNQNSNFEGIGKRGTFDSKFNYSAPLMNKTFNPRNKSTEIDLDLKIKDGLIEEIPFYEKIENINSRIVFNNSVGIKKGFLDLTFNKQDFAFKLKTNKKDDTTYTQISTSEFIDFNNLFFKGNFPGELSGRSQTEVSIKLPSYLKASDNHNSELLIYSKLEGTSIALSSVLQKKYQEEMPFSLNINSYNDTNLNFKIGDSLRGKFKLSPVMGGFIILGEKKRTISIEPQKIIILGNLKDLNLDTLNLTKISGSGFNKNLFIEGLSISNLSLGNYSLKDVLLNMEPNEYGPTVNFVNDEISGSLGLREDALLVDLDYLDLNLDLNKQNTSFLDFFNNFDQTINFNIKEININRKLYGSWSFTIRMKQNTLVLGGIKGNYGEWGVLSEEDKISNMNILKTRLGWRTEFNGHIYSKRPIEALNQIGFNPSFDLKEIDLSTNFYWNSLPWDFEYNELEGSVYLKLEELVFDETDYQNQMTNDNFDNIRRLMGIMNPKELDKIFDLRRWRNGFIADSLQGELFIKRNYIVIKTPLILKTSSGDFEWSGEISRTEKGALDSLDLEMTMTLPLKDYLNFSLLGGPIAWVTVRVAGKALEESIDKIASGKWIVEGTISDPVLEFEGWFKN